MRTLIIASLIFLFIAVGGVVGYLYFVAEPKRHTDEPATSSEPEASKPVDKDQEVPMPDAGSSQSSPPQKQNVPQPETESPEPQKQEFPVPPVSQESEKSEPMRITAGVVQPVLVHRVNPDYPEIARKSRIEGVVILEAVITKEGNVAKVRVLRGVYPVLDQSAVNAVQKWRYKPATLNGKPVKVYSTITVNFKLR